MKIPMVNWRQVAVFCGDLIAVVATWLVAYLFRFNGAVPEPFADSGSLAVALILPVYAFSFWNSGLYRGIWIFASLPTVPT